MSRFGSRSFGQVVRMAGLAVCALVAAGCGSPLVAGECKEGYRICGGRCVDVSNDFRNCGACGNECAAAQVCSQGMCVASPDAGMQDGSLPDGGPRDGGGGVGGMGGMGGTGGDYDASLPDASLSGCGLGELECAGSCVTPRTDPDHCGECGVSCGGGFCANGSCSEGCEAPLQRCGNLCIDTQTDPVHCGSCNNPCASGICEDGTCADATAGHLVVIGHDFSNSNPVMRRLAGNAVFLARGTSVRVLVFEGSATGPSIDGTDAAIDFVADRDGRTWERVEGLEPVITKQLAEVEAFVVYAQPGSTGSAGLDNAELRKWGQDWGNALVEFLRRGGVVVVFEDEAAHDGTFQVLEPGGMFSASGRAPVSGIMSVAALGDAVALGASGSYMSMPSTVYFEDVDTPGTTVVEDPDGNPVIVHRVVSR